MLWATGGLNSFVERWWINLEGSRPPGIRAGRRGTAPAPSVHVPTVRAPPRLIHLSVGLIVQLLLGARINHMHPLVPATTSSFLPPHTCRKKYEIDSNPRVTKSLRVCLDPVLYHTPVWRPWFLFQYHHQRLYDMANPTLTNSIWRNPDYRYVDSRLGGQTIQTDHPSYDGRSPPFHCRGHRRADG